MNTRMAIWFARSSRKAVYLVLFVALLALAFEGISCIVWRVATGSWLSFAKVRARVDAVAAEKNAGFAEAGSTGGEVIHPYLGYVYNPAVNNPYFTQVHGCPVSSYGFIDDKNPVFKRAPDKLIVGVFGGSAAYYLSVQAVTALTNALHAAHVADGRQIVIVRTALGGYKQPQQLMALSYLLSLGAEFDVVLNYDGFNEVALPIAENCPKQVNPFYPRSWYYRMQTAPNERLRLLMGRVAYLRDCRAGLAALFSNSWFCHTATGSLVWRLMDAVYARCVACAALAVQQANTPGHDFDFSVAGPPYGASNVVQVCTDLAALWHQCSLQMHRLCTANGIVYIHVLQPSPYLEGCKTMTPKERQIACSDTSPFSAGARAGYPLLAAHGDELVRQGVRFHNLSAIFKDVRGDIFTDGAAHVNQQGNVILGSAVGSIMATALNAPAAPTGKP